MYITVTVRDSILTVIDDMGVTVPANMSEYDRNELVHALVKKIDDAGLRETRVETLKCDECGVKL